MADRVGQQLGNYRLVRLLGKGGYAEVYLGVHIYLESQAAIKVLRTMLSDEHQADFLTEARRLSRLKHPHIVHLLDFGIEEEVPFLVMEYAPNGSLRTRHPKGSQVPLATIISYVKQVADALHYIHRQKLVHRDIKPENILLGPDQEVLLSDLGIAVLAHTTGSLIAQGQAGTPPYMAPEQIQGLPREASDQYALGIVVYEWLSGNRPFHGSFIELCTQHLSASPPPLSEKGPAISPDVEQVVLMALEKDPNRRFESVQAFATALERACQLTPSHQGALPREVPLPSEPSLFTHAGATILPGQSSQPTNVVPSPNQPLEPAVAATSTHTPDVSPPTTREAVPSGGIQSPKRVISRRIVLVGLAAGLAFTGGITYLLASPNWAPTSTHSPTPIFTYRGHSGPVTSVAWSPDGKHIASASVDGTVQVWDATTGSDALIFRGGSALVTYYIDSSRTSNPVPVWSVAWSPDGKYIASAGQDHAVHVWEAIEGGRTHVTYNGHSDDVDSAKWSPDGTHIASGSADRTVQVWDALHGGRALVTHSGYSAPVKSVAWSPSGTRIVAGSRDGTVRLWDATNGGRSLLTYNGHYDAVNVVAWSPDGTRIASASDDHTVQVWDPTSGITLITYNGHSDIVNPVAWSPDSKGIASGSWDYTVQVWDPTSGITLITYNGHSGHVNAVAWSPDGTRIASGGGDKTIQVWEAM